MRQDMHTNFRTLDVYAPRRLPTRGHVRDMETLATHQSMRSAVPHYGYPRSGRPKAVLRWLRAQAGRPWNAVYAELRRELDARNTVQQHVLDDVLRRVQRHDLVVTDDAQVRVRSAWGPSYPVSGLYVHPVTKLLCYAQAEMGAAKHRAELKQKELSELGRRRIVVSTTLQLHKLDGQWYWVELAPVTPVRHIQHEGWHDSLGQWHEGISVMDHDSVCRDAVTGQAFFKVPKESWETRELMQMYGMPAHYAKRKWQASSADIARHVKAP